jgi:hypothetical protein
MRPEKVGYRHASISLLAGRQFVIVGSSAWAKQNDEAPPGS